MSSFKNNAQPFRKRASTEALRDYSFSRKRDSNTICIEESENEPLSLTHPQDAANLTTVDIEIDSDVGNFPDVIEKLKLEFQRL